MLMASLNHHESQTLRDWITFQISDKFLTENGIFLEGNRNNFKRRAIFQSSIFACIDYIEFLFILKVPCLLDI